MTIDVHPESLRALSRQWDDAAGSSRTHGETLSSVGAGGHQFGRINQLLTPALVVFMAGLRQVALAQGEQWEEGAVALRQSALDLELTDGDIARLLSQSTAVGETTESEWIWV